MTRTGLNNSLFEHIRNLILCFLPICIGEASMVLRKAEADPVSIFVL